jgi:hypothetical protein
LLTSLTFFFLVTVGGGGHGSGDESAGTQFHCFAGTDFTKILTQKARHCRTIPRMPTTYLYILSSSATVAKFKPLYESKPLYDQSCKNEKACI